MSELSISSFDAAFFALAVLVPGFILDWAISLFIPKRVEDPKITTIRFLTLSSLNFAFWSWLFFLIIKTGLVANNMQWTAFSWFIIIFVSPVLFGILVGHFGQKGLLQRFLNSMGMNPMHSSPTAWDYVFGRLTGQTWTIVTLKDDSQIAGLFGYGSLSSSLSTERDLYIEQAYKVSDDGSWEMVQRTNGILVKGDAIKHIEFWSN